MQQQDNSSGYSPNGTNDLQNGAKKDRLYPEVVDIVENHALMEKSNHVAEDSETKTGRCVGCRSWCHKCCIPCRKKYNPRPRNPSRLDRVKYSCLCPPGGKPAKVATLIITVLLFWGTLWSITKDEALPGGNFFALVVLMVCAVIGGIVAGFCKLPPLLGMLAMGFALRNVPVINIAKDISPQWSGALRSIALVVILVRAGLGLDPVALRRLSGGVLRLAILPSIAEAVIGAVSAHLLLGFSWDWGFILGFVVTAVSPAVVVPSMLALRDKGYGVDKGIPTLVVAAASLDNVLAISGFGVALGITFSKANLVLTIFKGPLEALAGVVFGILFGIMLWYLPHGKHSSNTLFRFLILCFGTLLAMFGSRAADISGAGALAALTVPFVAAFKWRKDPVRLTKISHLVGHLWTFFQPLLFGLIGAEVDISKVEGSTLGLGCAVLACGMVVRLIVTFLAVFRTPLNLKERLFVVLAWLPKATVQAAVGSVALDTARDKGSSPDILERGAKVLTIAVLVILITAPIGAAAISLSAPRLLHKTTPPDDAMPEDEEEEEEDEDEQIPLDHKPQSAEV